MILKKEFYFIRHGQTDHNISENKQKEDYPFDIPLNQTGTKQAQAAEPLIACLPIRTICYSPMRRAKETKEIVTHRLKADHHEILELKECTAKIWRDLSTLGQNSSIPVEGDSLAFINQVKKGLNKALALPGPLLIVAHGGVHWAISYLMNISNHEWAIENCKVIHFSIGLDEQWKAKKLN